MASDDQRSLVYLIDGHAQFFRAYYAIRSGMSSPVTGEPTNMTFGFMGMLLKLLRDNPPDYLAVAIDVSGDKETFRSEIYPDYKAQRKETPEDFHPQVERCLELLRLMQVPVIGVEEVEADDVLATLAKRLVDPKKRTVRILSRDKDLTQILQDGVELFDPHKDELVEPSALFKTEGVKPEHVIDILSLMGDSSDNIPGVPGIGPKTAAQLILEYGSIKNLLKNIDQIKGKKRDNIIESQEKLKLNQQLVTLKDDLKFEFDLTEAQYKPDALQIDELEAEFNQLGFNQHLRTLKALTGDEIAKATAKKPPATVDSEGLFPAEPAGSDSTTTTADYQIITTKMQLQNLVKQICKAGECAVDTETDSLFPRQAQLCGVSISLKTGTGYYIPTHSPPPHKHLSTDSVLEILRPVLMDTKILKIGHNLKYDLNVLRHNGLDLTEKGSFNGFDTMVASYVIDATRSSHKLDVLALSLLNYTCIPISELIGTGKSQITFDKVPLEQAAPYAAEDADITLRLRNVLLPQLDAMGLRELFDTVEMPLVPVLAELEYNGITVNPDELDRQCEQLNQRIEDLRDQIRHATPEEVGGVSGGGGFNPDSPKQLAQVLFNRPDQDPPGLGLKVIKRRKTGPSTDQEVLEKLAEDPSVDTPLPEMIIEYRQLTKLVNTYLVALKKDINPQTKRVHASFNQTVTATGRLSSSSPNLQNIPIRTEIGREIRRAFVAAPGHVLITADYSQIELRLLAHLSQDQALIQAFRDGLDIHTAVAAEVFDVPLDEVTFDQRSTAKMVNFGIVYGITPFGLSRRLGSDISITYAGQIIDDYKARYNGINAFLAECVQQAEMQGYVETILHRRRAIPQIRSANRQQRALAERLAINTVVQGSAADLIKIAMIQLYRDLSPTDSQVLMLLQIHDELVFEAPKSQAEKLQEVIVKKMESAMPLDVPLVVDSASSTCWIDAK